MLVHAILFVAALYNIAFVLSEWDTDAILTTATMKVQHVQVQTSIKIQCRQ